MPEALRLLHAAGVSKIVMLSGDNQRTVDAIAKRAGIDEARGDLMPEQKIEHVKRLMAEHHHVGMIGDGVNDAPALAQASVGIAMGAIGSDTAIETADMALMKDDLTKVAEAVVLGRRTLRILQFNVAFALAIKAVFLLLAFTGHAGLWMAILADTGATLLVILNAPASRCCSVAKEGMKNPLKVILQRVCGAVPVQALGLETAKAGIDDRASTSMPVMVMLMMVLVVWVIVVAVLLAAVVAHRAPAADRAPIAVAPDDHTFAIDSRAAGAAGVGEAAAIGRAVITRLCVRRGHHSKAGDNGQKSQDLFHSLGVLVLDLLGRDNNGDT